MGKWQSRLNVLTYISIVFISFFVFKILQIPFTASSYDTAIHFVKNTDEIRIINVEIEAEQSKCNVTRHLGKQLCKKANSTSGRYNVDAVKLQIDESTLTLENNHVFTFRNFLADLFFRFGIRNYSETAEKCCENRIFFGCRWKTCFKVLINMAIIALMFSPVIWHFVFHFAIQKQTNAEVKKKIESLNMSQRVTFGNLLAGTTGDSYVIFELVNWSAIFFVYAVHMLLYAKWYENPFVVTPLKCPHFEFETFMKILLQEKYWFGEFRLCSILLLPISIFSAVVYLISMYAGPAFSKAYLKLHQIRNARNRKRGCKRVELQRVSGDANINNTRKTSLSFSAIYCLCLPILVILDCVADIGIAISMLYTTLIGYGVIHFCAESIIYLVTGVLLNYDAVLGYLGLVLFLFLYGHEKVQLVYKKYEVFKTQVAESLQFCYRCELESIEGDTISENYRASQLKKGAMAGAVLENGEFQWKVSGGLVFFNKSWKYPVISVELLEHLALGSNVTCPGSVHGQYCKALLQILLRVLILAFILNIILSLSQDLSVGIKTIFVITTGFLLTSIGKFSFFQDVIHTGGLYDWEKGISEIPEYKETWPITDIDLNYDNAPIDGNTLFHYTSKEKELRVAEEETDSDVEGNNSDINEDYFDSELIPFAPSAGRRTKVQ